jgi:DNA end-binding protein Ku
MARPIWTGTISFGLLQVPVRLMTAERRTDLHFRMLDSRDNAPIRYERVNSETGEEVPWKDVVKAFEYSKGNYVVIEADEMREAAPESAESVDIEAFVEAGEIDVRYFDKPYLLAPAKRGEKGYVLLREALRKSGLAGVARVVIRKREHLALVVAGERALLLMLLRYPQELVDEDDYDLPGTGKAGLKISAREMNMATRLVDSMREPWRPSEYHDDYRERLVRVIKQRLESGEVAVPEDGEREREPVADATNVVDFMPLLKKSIAENRRQPAKKRGGKPASRRRGSAGKSGSKRAGKSPGRKSSARKSSSPGRKSKAKRAQGKRRSSG